MSNADLDTWKNRGVGGFVCKIDYLAGLGGSQQFAADPSAPLTGSTYDLQRQIRDTGIVQRAAARGIKLWIGMSAGNYWNDKTPWAEWFDDATWSNQVVPNMTRLAGAARMLGFAGLAFDEELYPGKTGKAGTWVWSYVGNTHTESEVRDETRIRGAQLMQAIVAGYPGVDIIDVGWRFPQSWEELVQQEINGIPNAETSRVSLDFWNGMTSSKGYGPIRFIDSVFYKSAHLNRATWDAAYTYNTNRLFALFSRVFTNWNYEASKVQVAPFVWISSGATTFDTARSPDYVATQLAAARRWATGGTFANYAFHGLSAFDYTPYITGLQAAATPGTVDTQAPSIDVTTSTRSGSDVLLSGSAHDDMAIRSVQWQTTTGKSGAAPMTWTVTGGDYQVGYQWRMDWSLRIPAASGERITLTVWDSKGLPTSSTVVAP